MLELAAVVAFSILALLAIGLSSAYASHRRSLRASLIRLRDSSRIAETASGPIEFAEAGDGMPLLVSHGAGGGFDQGLELGRPLLSRGFRIIATSRFGYLRTPLPADSSAAAQADAHAHLMDVLGIQRAAILGASAGAPSAVQFAVRYPERCTALVLLVPLIYKPPELAASMPKVSPWAETVLMTIVGSDFVFWLASRFARDEVIKRVLGTPPEIVQRASPDEKARVRRILETIEPISSRIRGILNDARVSTSLTRYELEKITAPTLVLSVRDDGYGTFAGAAYTASKIPNARFSGYEIGGHLAVGHQTEVIEKIAQFLVHSQKMREAESGARILLTELVATQPLRKFNNKCAQPPPAQKVPVWGGMGQLQKPKEIVPCRAEL